PAPVAIRAWLGDAIAIKEPTCAVFRRQSGSNLVIIGQRDESATAMLGAAMVSIGAQLRSPATGAGTRGIGSPGRPTGDCSGDRVERVDCSGEQSHLATFHLLDATPADSHLAGHLERVSSSLGQQTRVIAYRELEGAMTALHAELARRQEAANAQAGVAS